MGDRFQFSRKLAPIVKSIISSRFPIHKAKAKGGNYEIEKCIETGNHTKNAKKSLSFWQGPGSSLEFNKPYETRLKTPKSIQKTKPRHENEVRYLSITLCQNEVYHPPPRVGEYGRLWHERSVQPDIWTWVLLTIAPVFRGGPKTPVPQEVYRPFVHKPTIWTGPQSRWIYLIGARNYRRIKNDFLTHR